VILGLGLRVEVPTFDLALGGLSGKRGEKWAPSVVEAGGRVTRVGIFQLRMCFPFATHYLRSE
jgi:hypothetical protein